MSFVDSVKTVFSKYATFEGRARRSEYWWFTLFLFIVYFALSLLEIITKIKVFGFLYVVFFLAVFIPSLALAVRRLHDIGKSGWWVLISLIPVIGSIVLIVFALMDSEQRENLYGPCPK